MTKQDAITMLKQIDQDAAAAYPANDVGNWYMRKSYVARKINELVQNHDCPDWILPST
jgi:hypothetical protein